MTSLGGLWLLRASDSNTAATEMDVGDDAPLTPGKPVVESTTDEDEFAETVVIARGETVVTVVLAVTVNL